MCRRGTRSTPCPPRGTAALLRDPDAPNGGLGSVSDVADIVPELVTGCSSGSSAARVSLPVTTQVTLEMILCSKLDVRPVDRVGAGVHDAIHALGDPIHTEVPEVLVVVGECAVRVQRGSVRYLSSYSSGCSLSFAWKRNAVVSLSGVFGLCDALAAPVDCPAEAPWSGVSNPSIVIIPCARKELQT